jgi:gamma-glutamylcyclotransferase (GGCT)/AIG2-like uncharacterized protein YtfP
MSVLPDYLFVYGTLLSEVPSSMSKFLRRRAALIGRGTTSGRLIDLGGYPGFLSEGGTTRGEVYRIHAERAEETWQLLDAYEGVSGLSTEEYRRDWVEVKLEHGEIVRAQTYIYQQAAGLRSVIPGGDYLPFYASNPAHRKFTGHD